MCIHTSPSRSGVSCLTPVDKAWVVNHRLTGSEMFGIWNLYCKTAAHHNVANVLSGRLMRHSDSHWFMMQRDGNDILHHDCILWLLNFTFLAVSISLSPASLSAWLFLNNIVTPVKPKCFQYWFKAGARAGLIFHSHRATSLRHFKQLLGVTVQGNSPSFFSNELMSHDMNTFCNTDLMFPNANWYFFQHAILSNWPCFLEIQLQILRVNVTGGQFQV